MAAQVEVDELDVVGALTAFGQLRGTRDAAERDLLVLAAHFADLYNLDANPAGELVSIPGGQRGVRLGGDGTPLMWEFAIAEAAAELHTTTWATRRLIADALDVRHRLPRLWAAVNALDCPAWIARKVAQATRQLTYTQALVVDDEIADYAGRLPWRRFEALLEAKIIAADPDAAAARERAAAAEQFAKVGQSNQHGQKTLYVKTNAAAMARIDATLTYLADALRTLGDTDTEDQRRAKAMLLLANPTQAITLLQALATHHTNTSSDTGRSGGTDTDTGTGHGSGSGRGRGTGRSGAPRKRHRYDPTDYPFPDPDPDTGPDPGPDTGAATDQADQAENPAATAKPTEEPTTANPSTGPDDTSTSNTGADDPRMNDTSADQPAPGPDQDPEDLPFSAPEPDDTNATGERDIDLRDAGSPVEPPDRATEETAPPDPGPSPHDVPPDGPDPGPSPDAGPPDDPDPGPPEDPLARFFTPFAPDQIPPCPCRGGTYHHDTTQLLPKIRLYLHLHHDTIEAGNGVARWEDHGPITAAYIRDFLGPHAQFEIKPVIDPATLAPVDAYEIPERHREALRLRTPADVFPYASNTTRHQQIDHTTPYRRGTTPNPAPGRPVADDPAPNHAAPDHPDAGDPAASTTPTGQTGLHNLGPMTGYHHRVKTHAGWQLHQPIPGIYLWVAPHGSIYLVDHTGTRQLRGPGNHPHTPEPSQPPHYTPQPPTIRLYTT
ncbi:DUF222 domain-containing protein, partial [Nocardioides pakistanensis]